MCVARGAIFYPILIILAEDLQNYKNVAIFFIIYVDQTVIGVGYGQFDAALLNC